MTCNNCIHQTACFDWCRGFGQEAELCEHYSDKSEWFHLPCEVGETVFFLRDKNIIETSVEKFIFKGKGCYIKLKCNAMYETSCNSIGKTVFFTKESAKKALTERIKK